MFRLTISTTVAVEASPRTVWALLTDLDAHSRWNSTVTRIEGHVALGEKLSFEVPQAPGQKFAPTVIAIDEPRFMAWRINHWPLLVGERTYRIASRADGTSEFTVGEDFRGLLLPFVGRSWPDFVQIVEQTAADMAAAGATRAKPATPLAPET